MKKAFLLLLTGLFYTGLNALDYSAKKSDNAPNLELSFKLTDEGKKIGEYYLLIYCDTNKADTLFVQKGKVSYLYLEYNHNYTLRYVKEGYRDRVLIVRTDVSGVKRLRDFEFDFEISLIKENEPANTVADLPVGIVHYDSHKKKFDYSRKYHKEIRQRNHKSKNL